MAVFLGSGCLGLAGEVHVSTPFGRLSWGPSSFSQFAGGYPRGGRVCQIGLGVA